MKFEWDQNKNEQNIKKHQIDFENAKLIFSDSNRIIYQDLRNDYGEERFISIGLLNDTVIVVVYTIRKGAIRLISARYAKKSERNIYFNGGNNEYK